MINLKSGVKNANEWYLSMPPEKNLALVNDVHNLLFDAI